MRYAIGLHSFLNQSVSKLLDKKIAICYNGKRVELKVKGVGFDNGRAVVGDNGVKTKMYSLRKIENFVVLN